MEIKNIPEHFPEVQLQLIKPGYRCSDNKLSNCENVYSFMQELLKTCNTECVYVITLGTDFKPINYAMVGKGNANKSYFNISDIAKICLLSNACHCIIVHNHLSSSTPTPSQIDDNTSQKLIKVLHQLQINVCDFLITSPTGYYSYQQERRAPYDDSPANYTIDMPIPDPPYITLTKMTNLTYARKLYEFCTALHANENLPFEQHSERKKL